MEVECAEQTGDSVGDGDGRQVGVRVRRSAVRAEGPIGQDALDPVGRQPRGNGIPQCGVNEEAVDEHGDARVRGCRPADPVVDGTDGKVDARHGGLQEYADSGKGLRPPGSRYPTSRARWLDLQSQAVRWWSGSSRRRTS